MYSKEDLLQLHADSLKVDRQTHKKCSHAAFGVRDAIMITRPTVQEGTGWLPARV